MPSFCSVLDLGTSGNETHVVPVPNVPSWSFSAQAWPMAFFCSRCPCPLFTSRIPAGVYGMEPIPQSLLSSLCLRLLPNEAENESDTVLHLPAPAERRQHWPFLPWPTHSRQRWGPGEDAPFSEALPGWLTRTKEPCTTWCLPTLQVLLPEFPRRSGMGNIFSTARQMLWVASLSLHP